VRKRSVRLGILVLAIGVFASAAVDPNPVRASVTLHVPVLMYHHVRPPSLVPAGEQYPDLYVDPKLFDAQMAALKSWRWRTITARQLSDAVRTGVRVPDRTLVITFDDGRPDTFTYAYPILKKYGFTATFFVIPARIGTSYHLTASQLVELRTAGNEIANHTWDHRDLTTLTYRAMRDEIHRASDAIQTIVGVRPVTFAYPYGASNSTVISAAGAEGIYLAFTTQAGARENQTTRLYEPRVRVHGVTRRADGTFGGGTTATGLLLLLAPYAPPIVIAPSARLAAGTIIGTSSVPVRIAWSASDPSGIAAYGLIRSINGGSWTSMALSSGTATSLLASTVNGSTYRFAVRARNGAGATSGYSFGRAFKPFVSQESSASIAYSGSWHTASSTSYSGGSLRYSTSAGASATFTATESAVGWVTSRGPTRGSAAVYVDGVYRATISLYATTFQARRLVYAFNWTSVDTHTIKIVCLGTSGHPRVDVDAFVRLTQL
jgi:peptidoglycan/xylan/chitin deacetylase (PgdA/CDA1 family)